MVVKISPEKKADVNPITETSTSNINTAKHAKGDVASDFPLNESLTDEVITGGYSSNGDLTQDVLTDGGLVRGNVGGESTIEESKSRGQIEDDILVQENVDQDETQIENA